MALSLYWAYAQVSGKGWILTPDRIKMRKLFAEICHSWLHLQGQPPPCLVWCVSISAEWSESICSASKIFNRVCKQCRVEADAACLKLMLPVWIAFVKMWVFSGTYKCRHETGMFLIIIIIIIIHEFHGDTSLKQNFRATVNVAY